MVREVILKKYKNGGYISIEVNKLTPEFLGKIKADKDDKMGWRKYHGKLREKGYDV